MTQARMPGTSRRLTPGRWNSRGVAVPDIPPLHVRGLPPCKPLPKLEQRARRERRIAVWCLIFAAVFLVSVSCALLWAASGPRP
jgi:hypothetical protein